MNFFVRAMVVGCVVLQAAVALPVFAQGVTSPTVVAQAPATRSSNTQGTAGRAATRAVARPTTNACEFQGVHDPFCGSTISQIIGRIVQFLVGIAGALFLAMFVYGGAVWLTSGDSKRQEDAKKTLINAAFGVLIVIASYTIIAVLIGFIGGLGVSQGNVTPPETPTPQDAPAPAPTPTVPGPPAPLVCDQTHFEDACSASCAASGASSADCVALCYPLYSLTCSSGTATLDACQSNCSSACSRTLRLIDPGSGGTAQRSAFVALGCNSACPGWCRAAFGTTGETGSFGSTVPLVR